MCRTEALTTSRRDIVPALGLGAADLHVRVGPYLAAMKSAAQSKAESKVQMWVNVESFLSDLVTPAPFDRVQAQLATTAAVTTDIVTYE